VADTEPGTRLNRTGRPGGAPHDEPTEPETIHTDAAPGTVGAEEPEPKPIPSVPWIVTSVVVMVLAFGLLGLHAYGLTFFGTWGVVGVFALAELLGVAGLSFSLLARTAAQREDDEAALEDGSIGRRCAVCGLVFLGAMAIITVAAHVIPTAMVS
jgi:hypothetical protein